MFLRLSSILCTVLFMTACISPTSYVDPKYAAVDYQNVSVTPQDIAVSAVFLREDKPIKRAQKILQANVEEVLTNAGYSVVEEGAQMTFEVSFNNRVEKGAFGKGFGTGLTLGLAGTAVSDLYEVKIARAGPAGSVVEREYGHAIHTSIGNVSEPPIANVAPSENLNDAFKSMVEDVVLQFLIDAETGAGKNGEVGDTAEIVAFLPIIVPFAG